MEQLVGIKGTASIIMAAIFLMLAGCESDHGDRINSRAIEPQRAKNVILFIGDGMGISTVTAMRILAGQSAGGSGEDYVLPFEKFDNVALVKTYNSNQQVPDSAGTATALLTGQKTNAGVIGLDPHSTRADCKASQGTMIETLLERAEIEGLSTGVVTTARLTHATPAAAYAHTPERDWESDADMPEAAKNAGCADIAQQFLEFSKGDGIEVALGGGRKKFMAADQADPEYPEIKGQRQDGRDLIAEWHQKFPDGQYVWNREGFHSVKEDKAHLLGLFEPEHMQYEANRAADPSGEPSLSEMTKKAIAILSKNKKGFFLLVEGGRIDHGHHENNAFLALTDGLEFANAVEAAIGLTARDDTLILVTADHSHTFSIAGYPTRGNPILGKVYANDEHGAPMKMPALADDGKPYATLGYYTGPGASINSGRNDISMIDTTRENYTQQAVVFRHSGAHGGEDVAAYAAGPNASSLQGVVEQNTLFDIMHDALFCPCP